MNDKLHSAGFYVIKDIASTSTTFLQNQGWLNSDFFYFDDQEIVIWNSYVALLTSSHVRISAEDDQMIWSLSKNGKYTPKAGYLHLIHDRNEIECFWW